MDLLRERASCRVHAKPTENLFVHVYAIPPNDAFAYYLWSWEAQSVYTLRFAVELRPNLVAAMTEWSTLSPAMATPGSSLSTGVRVQNIGSVNAGPFDVSFWLGNGNTFHLLGSLALPGWTAGVAMDVLLSSATIPVDLAPGSYSIRWNLDSSHAVLEGNEGDNYGDLAETLTVP